MHVTSYVALLVALSATATDAGTAVTVAPTDAVVTRPPTDAPTDTPTDAPTESPTESPTDAPTETPTEAPTPHPSLRPTAPPTTPAPTPCVCEDQPWTFIEGRCIRGCEISGDAQYNARTQCCLANFFETGPTCITIDTCCDCKDLPVTYVDGKCVKGCGLSENGAFDTIGDCCAAEFGSENCRTNDECPAPEPTVSPSLPPTTSRPTSGSTPTVGTENTAPPTLGTQKAICVTEQDCGNAGVDLGLALTVDHDGSFPTKGCFYKNDLAFFSPGTAAEMATHDLPGQRVRLYCGNT